MANLAQTTFRPATMLIVRHMSDKGGDKERPVTVKAGERTEITVAVTAIPAKKGRPEPPFFMTGRDSSGRAEGARAMVGAADQLAEAGEQLAAEADIHCR